METFIWFIVYFVGVVATFGIFNFFTRKNTEVYEGAGPIIAIISMFSWIGFIFVCLLKIRYFIEKKYNI